MFLHGDRESESSKMWTLRCELREFCLVHSQLHPMCRMRHTLGTQY
jgi:hypothetical protein